MAMAVLGGKKMADDIMDGERKGQRGREGGGSR